MDVTIPLYVPPEVQAAQREAQSNATGSDHKFLAQLIDGYKWQQFVLSVVQSYGYWGAIHPLRIRPKRALANQYSDAFDIKIGSQPFEAEPWEQTIDVKARTRAFEAPEDFPFPTIIVEPLSRYEKRSSMPDWYAMVSQFPPHNVLFLSGATKLSTETKRGREYVTSPTKHWLTVDQFIESLPRIPEI